MKNKDQIILIKILDYIKELKEFLNGYTKSDFIKDRKTINVNGDVSDWQPHLQTEIKNQNLVDGALKIMETVISDNP